jgi:hypothetical protein
VVVGRLLLPAGGEQWQWWRERGQLPADLATTLTAAPTDLGPRGPRRRGRADLAPDAIVVGKPFTRTGLLDAVTRAVRRP